MWISYDIQYNYIDTYQYSTFNLPKINDYKASMDAAIYIYIDVCTMIIAFIIALYLQPVLNYKVFSEGAKNSNCSYYCFGVGRVKDEKCLISIYC